MTVSADCPVGYDFVFLTCRGILIVFDIYFKSFKTCLRFCAVHSYAVSRFFEEALMGIGIGFFVFYYV